MNRMGEFRGVIVLAVFLLTSTGSAWAQNNALRLGPTNTNTYVTFGSASPLGASNFTVEVWFNRQGTGVTTSTGTGGLGTLLPLVSKGAAQAEGSNVDANYILGINTAGNVIATDFEEGTGGAGPAGQNHPLSGVTPIQNNTWYHAAATYDGSTLRLYLNGELEAERFIGQPTRSDSIQHAGLGTTLTSTGTASGFFDGTLDEARIWNVARSATDVRSTMNVQNPSDASLVARWGLDEGSGTAVNDSAGTAQNGTITGTNFSWVTGAPFDIAPCANSASSMIRFGAVDAASPTFDDYVTFGNAAELGLATFTIETWFKREGTGTANQTGAGGIASLVPLVTKGAPEGEGSVVDANYILGINTSGNVLAADFEEGAGNSPGLNHPVSGTTPIANNIWYHAAATYDGSTWRLYLNGTLEAELFVGQPVRSDSIQHAGLGTNLNSSGSPEGFFNGVLDEARVWNTARTAAQIQSTINVENPSDASLVTRWGLNEGAGTTVNDSAGSAQNGTITGSNWSWANGAPFNLNLSPAPPDLNEPADGAAGVTTDPNLSVGVSDPDGDPLTVKFYARDASDVAPDFTVIALPDTQHYVDTPGREAIFNAQTQWIVANRVARNIVFVSQLGDCVENGDNGGDDSEWQKADTAMSFLEDPLTTMLPYGIPYGITVGNHDQSPSGDADGTTTFYNQYFGESRFLGRPYYGGHYGSNNDNHFELFSASGMDFIVVNFEYDTSPNQAVLDWADGLLQTHSGRRAIAVTHNMLGTGNPGSFSTQGLAIYDNLKDRPNLFLLLGGHVPGEGRRQDTFGGRVVHSLLADYQSRTNGGDGWLRILTFSPSNNTIRVQTYSPWLNQFETDADSDFTLAYDMGGAGFFLIGTNSNIPSGTDTSLIWSGRDPGTTYEWHVTVDDGTSVVTGPVWSFTTDICGNGIVGPGEGCDDGDTAPGDGCSASCAVETCYACNGQPSTCVPDNGAPCNDGLFCNGTDTCSGGSCGHSGDPCTGGTECADACNEAADNCFDSAGTPCASDGNVCTDDECNGTGGCGVNNTDPCNDGLFCNGTDTCSGGSCGHGGDPCTGGSECANACNESADNCFDTAGTPCAADGNVCTDDECNGSGGCGVNNTDPCDDELFCNGTDSCSGGSCGHSGDPCTGGTECADACNEGADNCFDTAGTACTADGNVCTDDECNGAGGCGVNNSDPCDDGFFCNGTDTCSGGSCGHSGDPCTGGTECANACNESADNCFDTAGTACTADGNVCTDDECDGTGGCGVNNSDPCEDGLFCNGAESCQGGLCQAGTAPCVSSCDEGGNACLAGNCPLAPQSCRTAQKSLLLIKDSDDDGRDKLVWKWLKGQATSQTEFGDPTDSAEYSFCLYAASTLIAEASVPAGTNWDALGDKGYKYKDGAGSESGVQKILVKGSSEANSKVVLKGRGDALPNLTQTIPLPEPVTVQLLNTESNLCWGDQYGGAEIIKNEDGRFKGKGSN